MFLAIKEMLHEKLRYSLIVALIFFSKLSFDYSYWFSHWFS